MSMIEILLQKKLNLLKGHMLCPKSANLLEPMKVSTPSSSLVLILFKLTAIKFFVFFFATCIFFFSHGED